MPLITAMADIDPPAVGVYQVVFQAVHPAHNWHRNVQILLDLEYNIKLQTGTTPGLRYAQQSPSGDLKQMAWEVENKAHNDKPFFSTAVRIGVARAGEKAEMLLNALSTFVGLFQHGGRPLAYLTDREYARTDHVTALAKAVFRSKDLPGGISRQFPGTHRAGASASGRRDRRKAAALGHLKAASCRKRPFV